MDQMDESYLGEATLRKLGVLPKSSEPSALDIHKTGEFSWQNYQSFRENIDNQAKGDTSISFAVSTEAAQEIIEKLDHAQTLFDFGSGIGFSALAFKEICPNLQSIHLVDAIRTQATPQLTEIIPTEFHHETIQSFISHPPTKTDIVLFAHVPEHGINSEEEVGRLADVTNPAGLVFEFGDTNLTSGAAIGLWKKHFDLIYNRTTGWAGFKERIWQKKKER